MIRSLPVQNLAPNAILKLAQNNITRVTLKQIYSIGRNFLQSKNPQVRVVPSQFIHAELPIRISHLIKMFCSSDCPIDIEQNKAFQTITRRHLEDVSILTQVPKPGNKQKEAEFTNLLKIIRNRHRNNMFYIGQGLKELLEQTKDTNKLVKDNKYQSFFDRFYAVNLGTQLIIDEHIALFEKGINLVQKVTPYDVAQDAINDSMTICKDYFGFLPKIELETTNRYLSTMYVKEHLHRIMFELIKFSIKCTINYHKRDIKAVENSTPIKIVIAEGDEDVSIKISDQAGGHPLCENDNVFRYIRPKLIKEYSSMPIDTYQEYYKMPINSYLHAMPIVRMTARYFGGDLSVYPMEGYGTDTFVYLSRTENTRENIPDDIPLNMINYDKELLENLNNLIKKCESKSDDKDHFNNFKL